MSLKRKLESQNQTNVWLIKRPMMSEYARVEDRNEIYFPDSRVHFILENKSLVGHLDVEPEEIKASSMKLENTDRLPKDVLQEWEEMQRRFTPKVFETQKQISFDPRALCEDLIQYEIKERKLVEARQSASADLLKMVSVWFSE